MPPGRSWAQEAGDVDLKLERYSYEDDDDDDNDDEEEEEEEANMIPGSRDRGTLTLPRFLPHLPPIPEGKAKQAASFQARSPACPHTGSPLEL